MIQELGRLFDFSFFPPQQSVQRSVLKGKDAQFKLKTERFDQQQLQVGGHSVYYAVLFFLPPFHTASAHEQAADHLNNVFLLPASWKQPE